MHTGILTEISPKNVKLQKNEPNLMLSKEAHNYVQRFLCLFCRLILREIPRSVLKSNTPNLFTVLLFISIITK